MVLLEVFFVRVLGHDVGSAWWVPSSHAVVLDALSLFAGQRFQVLAIVVGVRPDAAGWLGGCVDVELMRRFRVERPDPAFRERSLLIFHRPAVLHGDTTGNVEVVATTTTCACVGRAGGGIGRVSFGKDNVIVGRWGARKGYCST